MSDRGFPPPPPPFTDMSATKFCMPSLSCSVRNYLKWMWTLTFRSSVHPPLFVRTQLVSILNFVSFLISRVTLDVFREKYVPKNHVSLTKLKFCLPKNCFSVRPSVHRSLLLCLSWFLCLSFIYSAKNRYIKIKVHYLYN